MEIDFGFVVNVLWSVVLFDSDVWLMMWLFVFWENVGMVDFDGVVWFCCVIDVFDFWFGVDVEFYFGVIDDIESMWFNG